MIAICIMIAVPFRMAIYIMIAISIMNVTYLTPSLNYVHYVYSLFFAHFVNQNISHNMCMIVYCFLFAHAAHCHTDTSSIINMLFRIL
jgi:hypothetical protein